MTKRDTGGIPQSFGVPGFSLESILEECRDKTPEETAAPETAETEYRPETEVYSSEQAEYPAETEYEAGYPEEKTEYPEYEEYDTGAPEYETEPDTEPDESGPAESGEPDGRYYEDAPEPEETAEADVYDEGFEDDADFYAPPLEAPDEPEAPEETGETAETDSAGKKKKGLGRAARRGGRGRAPGLWGKLVGLLAAASIRRADNLSQPDPEPEDLTLEMPPQRAAKHYAAQMPSLRLRFFAASAVCVLLAWITLAYDFGLPLPGSLGTNARATSLVCLIGMLSVMLIGLDVVTAGVMGLIRGRAGAESMIVLAAIAAAADVIYIAASGDGSHGVTFAVIPAAAVMFALRGAWYSCRAYADSFLALHHAKDAYAVTSEVLPGGKKERILIKSRRSSDGLVRRSEEPSGAEALAMAAFVPMAVGSLALALALSLGAQDMKAFFHLFSLMTALCVSFNWTLSFPILFSRTARHLMMRGSALAGWSGARDVGRSRRLVLTDTDIFPEDAIEITGVRFMDKSRAAQVLGITGSMLDAAGTGLAAPFAELMRRKNAAMQTVEDFSVGEGGAKGMVQGEEVRIGTLAYMHLSGVKIPDKIKEENALYTAVSGELAAVFPLRYRPMASVQRALAALRREHRKPIFAVRDFNLDPLLLQKTFGVSAEGFQFPSSAERYRISGIPASAGSPAAGVMAQDGLDTLVDFAECGTKLHSYGRVCAWCCVICAALGAILAVVPAWQGLWTAIGAGRVLLYMLAWIIVPLALRTLLQK